MAGRLEFSRTVTVLTPESTALELELAGLGSRFAAVLLDTLCQFLLLALVALVAFAPLGLARGWPALGHFVVRYVWPLALLAGWVVFWGYYAWFETAWNGQSPGKRALGLRVVKEGGYAIDFSGAALRNVLRYVDLLPLVAPYLLGGATVLCSRHCRRVGDFVAGTYVIRERPSPWIDRLVAGDEPDSARPVGLTAGQLDRVTPEELSLVSEFLRRRDGLPLETRRALAAKLAQPLRIKLDAPQSGEASRSVDEDWLSGLQTGWMERRRRL